MIQAMDYAMFDETKFKLQTESLLCLLKNYEVGSKVENDNFVIKDGIVTVTE